MFFRLVQSNHRMHTAYHIVVKWRNMVSIMLSNIGHDDVIKWKHFPRYWPSVRGIHRSPVNSLHKGQWGAALMFSWICLNKRLSKQLWGWWFDTPSGSLWRHCNVQVMVCCLAAPNQSTGHCWLFCQSDLYKHISAKFCSKLFFQESVFASVVCKLAAILFMSRCDNCWAFTDHSEYGLGQWEKALHSNSSSHYLRHIQIYFWGLSRVQAQPVCDLGTFIILWRSTADHKRIKSDL